MANDAFFGQFETFEVGETVALLLRARQLAREVAPELAQRIHEIAIGLLADVNRVGAVIAGTADGAIIAKMLATHSGNRPLTGNMESHVRSLPGPLGLVEVAEIAELDKVVNPNGYGPFWRAQEYGTGTDEVPSQEGRVLFGTFEPSETPPDADQRGLGVGRDAAFIPGGANPGFGTINVELPGRHFLRDGFAEAGEKYLQQMAAIRDKWDAQIAAVIGELKVAASRGTRFTGVIEA